MSKINGRGATITGKEMLTLVPYTEEMESQWNASVEASRNGTFLLDRRFMDYHRDRFMDCSLMFKRREKVLGCFPANYDAASHTVYSHQGLTYGGLLLHDETSATQVMEMLHMLIDYYKQTFGASRLIYKLIPSIYHRYPSEEDRYALFREGGKLTARGISSAINLHRPIGYDKSRRRMLRKGEASSLNLYQTNAPEEFEDYWKMLDNCLMERHHVHPVHSCEEMQLLSSRFPEQIQYYACRTQDGELVAGCWLFMCNRVVHTQYMTVSDHGKKTGALDYMISCLKEKYKQEYDYLDFGISTEDNGRYLNENLIYQKEGLGGRGICYDIYELKL